MEFPGPEMDVIFLWKESAFFVEGTQKPGPNASFSTKVTLANKIVMK